MAPATNYVAVVSMEHPLVWQIRQVAGLVTIGVDQLHLHTDIVPISIEATGHNHGILPNVSPSYCFFVCLFLHFCTLLTALDNICHA